jgi:hypothetical protein
MLAGLYLSLLLAGTAYSMLPGLFRAWYFSSDEYVFAAEVIRFTHWDFRQHFFDIPGTPFMLLSAVLWRAIHTFAHAGRFVPATSFEHFTFDHLPGLFILMRSLTLTFFLASLVLMFLVATRLTNYVGGAVAALLLATRPVYVLYSSFTRTESLAVCLFLAGVLCILGSGDTGGRARAFAAGTLAGLAAAARLHSITATIPLLLLLVFLPHRSGSPSRRITFIRAGAVGVILVIVASIVLATHSVPAALPSPGVMLLVLASGAVIVGALAAVSPAFRVVVRHLSASRSVLLLSGAMLGMGIGMVTIFAQWDHFVQSYVMYTTTYRDFDRSTWSFFENIWWVLRFYIPVIAPERTVILLLGIGAVAIGLGRDKRLIAVLIVALSFFVSRPLTLRASPHHVILWLPLFAIVTAYPVAWVCHFGYSTRTSAQRLSWVVACVVIALLAMLVSELFPTFTAVRRNVTSSEERLRNVAQASDWIATHTRNDAAIAVSYYCFNPGVFYAWLHALEVPVPPYVLDGREYVIWWGQRSALAGKTGYAMATRLDVESLKNRTDEVSPGEGTDPFTEQRFTQVARFGQGDAAVTLFRFGPELASPPPAGP